MTGDLNIYLASTKSGALRVGLSLERQCDCIEFFNRLFPNSKLSKDYFLNQGLIQAIEERLVNKRPKKNPDFDFWCTPFQRQVLNTITMIPFGETRSYREIGSMIGKTKGARAIGQALSKNPLPLIFPCHRVVAAGGIGGFSGGLALKRYLLNRERSKLEGS